jgi:hypothetical protein
MKLATMKKVWQPKQAISFNLKLKQVMADSILSPLQNIWPNVLSIIVLEQF